MPATKEELLKVSEAVGYTIREKEVDEYMTLLERMDKALNTVAALDGIAHVLICTTASQKLTIDQTTNHSQTTLWRPVRMSTFQKRKIILSVAGHGGASASTEARRRIS